MKTKKIPQCKHHRKKKLSKNEYWSPNPFELRKTYETVDRESKGDNETSIQERDSVSRREKTESDRGRERKEEKNEGK